MPPARFIVRSLSWRIALTVFAVNVLYVNSYLGNPMSKSILDLTVSLVDRHSLNIDPYAGNSTDVSYRRGRLYSGMPPGLSLVCVPYYVAAKTWLWAIATPAREQGLDERFVKAGGSTWRPSEKHLTIVLLNLFICVFGCSVLAGVVAAFFHRALTLVYPDLEERRRLVTTWLFSFGTLWFIYSPGIYHRIGSTFLCFAAFLLVLLPEEKRPALKWRGFLFGLALGLAVATSYELALVAAVLVLYGASRWGRRGSWGWAAVGAAIFLGLLAVYHMACFGAPWATPYAWRIQGSSVPPIFRTIVGAAPPLQRGVEFLVGSDYGFFFYSPLLLLALPALARLRRGGPDRAVAAVAFGIFAVLTVFHFVTGYIGLPGEFGFRMMKPAIPFLMLLVPMSYRWSYRGVVPVLTALSALILGKGVMFGVHAGRPFWGDYVRRIAEHGLSNYTLEHLQTSVWPQLSPWAISAVHLAALATILLLLWYFIWRPRNSRGSLCVEAEKDTGSSE